jgi:hypothetical protein
MYLSTCAQCGSGMLPGSFDNPILGYACVKPIVYNTRFPDHFLASPCRFSLQKARSRLTIDSGNTYTTLSPIWYGACIHYGP